MTNIDTKQSAVQQRNAEQAAVDARKAEEDRRAAATKVAVEDTKKARASSKETLAEQSAMKPVPSQEDADKMMSGTYDATDAEEIEQPDGPRARALQTSDDAGGSYRNRAAKSG